MISSFPKTAVVEMKTIVTTSASGRPSTPIIRR